jgi:hypothetical protein
MSKIMHQNLKNILLSSILIVAIMIFGSVYTDTVQASHNDNEESIDEEDLREWRRQSSRLRDSINDLDDDPVEDLPIPILFGVSPDDLIDNFGDPRDGGARIHQGLDILAPEGTPIVSPTEAVVIRISEGARSGNYVTTANPGDERFVYMHLMGIADIDEGDVLDVGDLIGYVGDTGNALGGPAHLHFEIRDDREATDPLPRLTEEFSFRQKIDFLEKVLRDVDDEDQFAEFLVSEFLGTFIQARAQGILLPDEIVQALPASLSGGTIIGSRDLTLGSVGPDVLALQSILIAEGYLLLGAPTEYFGPLTQAALQKYQLANGISPASGYFGSITRTHMIGTTGAGAVSDEESREELIAKIAELTALVKKLQAQLEN